MKIKLILFCLVGIYLTGCETTNSDIGPQEISTISIKLMDAPGDYDNVFVEILDVRVKVNDDSENENGWQSLDPINTGIYDLLELTGGVNVLLVDDFQIPSGELNQIRLVLGENNSIVIDGETFPLNTPSGQQSGLKIKIDEPLETNIAYTFLLDFEVDESIVIAGNSGNINLKPVIRASVEAQSGAISGTIAPSDVQVAVIAANGLDDYETFADADGNFVLAGLPEGTYTVTFNPDPLSGLLSTTIENVNVTIGETTDLGLIELE
ncbi:MAG: DUF4382 domain-containing protein [Bacteroidia bacterium]|nr:DUF4382 domain-containing protein [Bacteroidia bacterium]NND25129.1 DUF4382 domain-containing protein [Flavobacteriaceae bacterium]NNK61502.1 DUF4382 domain-containing protein [Flavobacteriaceae bacterium]NNL32960.1 DUF4382 domain-containing protein [Flavobacteriaceae bacterium]